MKDENDGEPKNSNILKNEKSLHKYIEKGENLKHRNIFQVCKRNSKKIIDRDKECDKVSSSTKINSIKY